MTQDIGSGTDLRSRLFTITRWLVAAYVAANVVRLVVGLTLFPQYVQTQLDSKALNTPNDDWTVAQTRAASRMRSTSASTAASTTPPRCWRPLAPPRATRLIWMR
jgi:hypothetical protein